MGLMAVNRDVPAQAESPGRADRIVLDMDSSESPRTRAASTTGISSRSSTYRLCFARIRSPTKPV